MRGVSVKGVIMKRKITAAALILALMLSFAACGSNGPSAKDLSPEHETKFGGIYLHMTIDDFVALGFDYGDSVDISFSNGYKLEGIPFYNGYYTVTGGTLLVAYPGYPYIKACINNGDDLYTLAGIDDACTASVTLNESGKYLAVQNAMSMTYTNERANYASDEVFANFRVMTGGKLSEGLFCRSASPCDDQYSRAGYSSALCEKAGIAFVLDLADSEEETAGYYADDSAPCPYWKSLYEKGKVLELDMSSNYRDPVFAGKVAEGMRAVINEEGPFLVHCTEGKDRTGFVCFLIEALAGASIGELEADYMTTYDNYYGVTKTGNPEGYAAVMQVKFNDFAACLCGDADPESLTSEQLVAGAEQYLRLGGMSSEEIIQLENRICPAGGAAEQK